MAPFLDCKEDLAFERERAERELVEMRTKFWIAESLHAACEKEKETYPDIDEFHNVYFNNTYPANVTTTV